MKPRAFQNRPVDEDPAIVMVKMTHTGGSDTLVVGVDFTLESNGTHQPGSRTGSGMTGKERLMAKAVVDPTELRQFATDLRRFNQELDNHMRVLQTRIQNLSQTWRDQEQVKFSAEFEEALRSLTRFREASEVHAPFLIRKAERVEEYLKQR